ncbi:hypothetical protein HN903_01920 [archaeon]|jgi:hypothetical protein|nr:hypothetical protein [archaeon]MBT6955668.1 hypothetical protein [archaeon]MBT7128490.1 hypothetical protein [archaeon]
MILEKIALTLLLATGTPEIRNIETPTIPYSEPAKQELQHRIPEAIYSEERHDFYLKQTKL